jgi:hypothetical protein
LWVTTGALEGCEGSVRERHLNATLDGGRAQEVRNPKGAKAPTRTKPPGARGVRLAAWDEAVGASAAGWEVCCGNARTEERKETFVSITQLEKSFEGRSPGALGAEIGFRGYQRS